MNTLITVGLLLCLGMVYASALPEPVPIGTKDVQTLALAAPITDGEENLETQESRWDHAPQPGGYGGYGRGGYGGGRHGR